MLVWRHRSDQRGMESETAASGSLSQVSRSTGTDVSIWNVYLKFINIVDMRLTSQGVGCYWRSKLNDDNKSYHNLITIQKRHRTASYCRTVKLNVIYFEFVWSICVLMYGVKIPIVTYHDQVMNRLIDLPVKTGSGHRTSVLNIVNFI